MAARGLQSPFSSRSASPDNYPERYDDPFLSPADPIELGNMSRRSADADADADGARGLNREASIGRDSLRGLPKGSYFSSRTPGQYAPIPSPQSAEQTPTIGGSTFSVGSMNPYKSADADTQALVDQRAGELAQWRVHWTTPALIVALFVAGVMGSAGHHMFYKHLDGKPAENQLKMIRYGTALAFFVKSTLVGTIIICYRQRIWHTFRTRAMTIKAIDGLFSATEDPTQFWNWEMMWNGKLATLMAACSWLIPIASVLSPASLTSEMTRLTHNTTCTSVASLNFSRESEFNYRTVTAASLIYYNTTDKDGKADDWFDYYDQPAKMARRLTMTSAYLKKPLAGINASVNNCGPSWNCSYAINFAGPGYKCDEIANSSHPVPDDNGAPFNISILAPEGNRTYYANVDINDYAFPQIETGDDGVPTVKRPLPATLGVFESEPVLWIGYARNSSTPYDASSPYAKTWKNVQEPRIFKCVAYHTKYTFEIGYNDTVQKAELRAREFSDPVVDTTVVLDPRNQTEHIANPSSNWVRPGADPGKYKLTAAYHGMGALLRNFLRGEINYKIGDNPYFVTKSDLSETRLVEGLTSYPVENLMEEIQSFYEEMLITLLSEPSLVVAQKEDVLCQKSQAINVFVYHREGLWIGYAIAVVSTFAFIVVGAWSIFENGVASDTQFSRIMVTTRNPTIDRLSVGACLGGDPFPRELRETKLRFGVLLEEEVREGPLGRVEHCTFGTAGETKEIVKYGTYAGLKKWIREGEEEVGALEEKRALLEGDEEHKTQ